MMTMRAKLAKDPYIRALGMKVYASTPRSLLVVGGSRLHEILVQNDRFICDCAAASFGRFCAHIAAVEYVAKQEKLGKDLMSQFTLDRSSSERGTPVPLPRKNAMLYGGLFSSWWLHEGEFGTSVGLKVLVTHVAAGTKWEKLEQLTEAATFVNPKWYFNSRKNQASGLMQFVRAITGFDYAQLEPLSTDEVKDLLNRNIGNGILVSAAITTDKKGNERNTIVKDKMTLSVDAADKTFYQLASAMHERVTIETNQNGFAYIKSPTPAYQDGTQNESDLSDEVPF